MTLNVVNGTVWTLSVFATSPSTGLNCKLDIRGLSPATEIKEDINFTQMLSDLGRKLDIEALGKVASDWRMMTPEEVEDYLDDEEDAELD